MKVDHEVTTRKFADGTVIAWCSCKRWSTESPPNHTDPVPVVEAEALVHLRRHGIEPSPLTVP